MNHNDKEFTNLLIHETSPYLLQHAHNPVDWHAWNDKTLDKAKQLNKLILVSIGYSACHWCHVMEKESFEDVEIAQIMNANFICIKVDREEHPDVDQVYMSAVQLINGNGGWPLNCFALPDGRPVWGGTYFPKMQWKQVLENINTFKERQYSQLVSQADELVKGIKGMNIFPVKNKSIFTDEEITNVYDSFNFQFDNENGGLSQAPKFPMPNNYQFLLKYYHQYKDFEAIRHIELTLKKMAYGGIYDQIGGGFARYATDNKWKVPHFEKMLYDNAQLLSLYSNAYQITHNELYREIVNDTITFIKRDLMNADGVFYAALDADSEGEEGKYYVWTKKEITETLKDNAALVCDYYNVEGLGLWEEDKNILLRTIDDEAFANKWKLTLDELYNIIYNAKFKLMECRSKRTPPATDDKILTSWNALMITGLVDAYKAFGNDEYLLLAQTAMQFLLTKIRKADGSLFRNYKAEKATIDAFLEDYFTIDTLINLYEADFNEEHLFTAKELAQYTLKHFFDTDSGLFYFNPVDEKKLFVNRHDVIDNVLNSSNSVMATVLFKLAIIFDMPHIHDIALGALSNMKSQLKQYPTAYSNWASLMLSFKNKHYTIVVAGKAATTIQKEINTHYIPNKILLGSNNESKLSHFDDRFVADKTMIYVCTGKECLLPTENVAEAIKSMIP